MTKYKVIKDFGSARKGDVLTNSAEDPQVFTMECSAGDIKSDNYSYRSMSISDDIADLYAEEGYLEEVKDNTNVTKTVELINTLIKKYESDYKEVMDKYNEGKVQPCVKVEAETVYFNLTKVLNKVREELTNE